MEAIESLSRVYLDLNPGTKLVPPAIVEADRLAALRAQTTIAPTAEEIAAVEAPLAYRHSASSSPATDCSDDVLGDNWGASWFLNNFCTEGNFRDCPTNIGFYNRGFFQRAWTAWRTMEGDFNHNGRIRISMFNCSFWSGCSPLRVVAEHDVLPRFIENWKFTNDNDRVYVEASSPCGHLHVAYLWK